jgi:transposase
VKQRTRPASIAPADVTCTGCGCACDPGFRLPDGTCATWEQHRGFQAGGYPEGTVDELMAADRNDACSVEQIKRKRGG